MKKVLCLLLTLVMILSSVTFISSAVFENEPKLQFGEDGKFTILQISDIQDGLFFCSLTKRFITDLLDNVQPDLVVLTGDNIGPRGAHFDWSNKLLIKKFMSIFEEKGVKVAAVFGNHDAENHLGKDEQFEVYKSYSCFIGAETEEAKELTGCGTYNIPIMSSEDETRKAFNLWFFDSQEYNTENDLGGYGCVAKDQIEWYEKTEAALTEENGGAPLPSFAFQHIIIPEVFEVFEKIPEIRNEHTEYSFEKNGEFYLLPEEYRNEDTFVGEACCPPEYSNGQADSLVENGNVLGIAVGHDHKNSFVVPYNTLDIVQTPTVGLGAYGNINRGARVITLSEDDLSTYETNVIFLREYYDLGEPALHNHFIANNGYDSHSVPERLVALFKWGYHSAIDGIEAFLAKRGFEITLN